MTLQNRPVIETLLAEEQGGCETIGEDCCAIIPMHTGTEVNLIKTLDGMKKLRDEHVVHSNCNNGLLSLWDWAQNLTWRKILQAVGMKTGLLVLMIMVVTYYVFPVI